MKFKVDENLPEEVCMLLRQAGHDAMSVVEQQLAGTPDSRLHEVCIEEERIMVTLDVGFANVQIYSPASCAGIIVLRLAKQDKPHVLRVVQSILPAIETETLAQRLWVVEEERIRIRE